MKTSIPVYDVFHLAVCDHLERAPYVEAFYNLVEPIKIALPSRDGSEISEYTLQPCVLAIGKKMQPVLQEWNTERQIERLARENCDYQISVQGSWRRISAYEEAWIFGLYRHLFTDDQLSPTLIANMGILEHYLREGAASVPASVREPIYSLVDNDPNITLADLVNSEALRHIDFIHDHIHTMIARNELCVDLKAHLLTNPGLVHVFRSEQRVFEPFQSQRPEWMIKTRPGGLVIDTGVALVLEGSKKQVFNIRFLGHDQITLTIQDNAWEHTMSYDHFRNLLMFGEIAEILVYRIDKTSDTPLQSLSKEDLADVIDAFDTYMEIKRYSDRVDSNKNNMNFSNCRQWLERYRNAEDGYGNGFIGLLPPKPPIIRGPND